MIAYFCDGCGTRVDQENIGKMQKLLVDYLKEYPERSGVAAEVFCPRCSLRAIQFWTEKFAIWADASEITLKRLEKHRRQFWAKLHSVPKESA